jgi:hypothetical protein
MILRSWEGWGLTGESVHDDMCWLEEEQLGGLDSRSRAAPELM